MAKRQRKIEVYKLTISGLESAAEYDSILYRLWGENHELSNLLFKYSSKTHALHSIVQGANRSRFRFLSFTKGQRPDILDTDGLLIKPNPLTANQTIVEWTHILGAVKQNRYVLLVERNFNGIWPSTIEHYFQMLFENFYTWNFDDSSSNPRNQIVVSLEPESGPEFIARMDALEHITEAKVRIVRPNPGWGDLESELGARADESDARKVDIVMTARRKSSLNKRSGLLAWIRRAFRNRELGFVAIKGSRKGKMESFNTEKLVRHQKASLELTDNGQIHEEDIWNRLDQMMDELD